MTSRISLLVISLSIACDLALPAQQRDAPHIASGNLVSIDASAPIAPPETGYLHMGGTSSTGHSLQVNSRYLTLDGKPWLPIMGEMHYSRVPEAEWEDEILKMKAGGVNIVSTYVFWIHHEEVEGQFDWTGRRDLRRFVELCAKHGMYVYVRPGPWAHGEVRNGGFPDWLVKLPNTRSNDPVYLAHVATFFQQIGEQLRGLMFKDGGPIIGAQLENEYAEHGAGRGAEHILKLKELVIAAGIDPPLFSVTGWPSLDFPPHDVIPVSGGYPDGFWYGSQAELPPSMNYLFNLNRELGDMGATVPTEDPTGKVDLKHDPDFAAEEAGGMASAYHRRPVLTADDIAALTLTGIGSGVNFYGYYMFHGGTNPPGKLTTLQESHATGFPNDLPEMSYDFEAPLGEFGQVRESYRKIRALHLFANAFGEQLAPMPAFGPAIRPKCAADTSVPRVAVRSNGDSGFVFVNNYVRQLPMPARPQFQIRVKLATGEIRIPEKPIEVPADSHFFWPFNLDMDSVKLRYSTAQLLTRLGTAHGTVAVFFTIPSIAPEFAFDAATVKSIASAGATVSRTGTSWIVRGMSPGLTTTIQVTNRQGATVVFLVLTSQQAEECSVLRLHDRDVLARTSSDVFFDGDRIHLRSIHSPRQQISFLTGEGVTASLGTDSRSTDAKDDAAFIHGLQGGQERIDGLWIDYSSSQSERHIPVVATATRTASPVAAMKMGPYFEWRKASVPIAPGDDAFATAGQWQLRIGGSDGQSARPLDMTGLSHLFLEIDYAGDIGHLLSRQTLLADNFYNGLPWRVGLDGFGTDVLSVPLTLEILPMPAKVPIYLDATARAILGKHQSTSYPLAVKVIPEYETVLTMIPSQ